MLKGLLRRPIALALAAALLARYLDFALRTTRWTLDGGEHLAGPLAGRPVVAAFWHERLALMPALWRHVRDRGGPPGHVLVSRHADGRVIGRVLARFGVGAVHGSTHRGGQDRGGAAGLRALIAAIERGDIAVITPDGPRGPPRIAAAGVAQLAAASGVPVLPCAAQTGRRRVLSSWDRMVIPLPWARGVLVCGPPIHVPADQADLRLPAIARALTEAAERADALCS